MKGTNFKEFLCSGFGKICMIIAIYIIILLLIVAGVNIFGNSDIFMGVCVVAFAVFGWKALSRITPRIFLIMPVAGWLFYFFVKGFLAIGIGIFVTPFVIAKGITNAIQESVQ